MKVLLIIRWPVGGIRTYIKYMFADWPSSEISLHLLTPNIPELNVLRDQLSHLDCTWHVTSSSEPGVMEFAKAARNIIRSQGFDLIHAHGFTSAIAVGWYLPFTQVNSIATSHDVLNENQFSGPVGFLKKLILGYSLNQFSIIHSVSNDAQANLLENIPSITKRKCCVISNGIDTEHFTNASAAPLKDNLGLSSEVTLIGFFGRFMSQKGFMYLVAAMESVESRFPGKYKVVCFGSGGFIREEKAVLEKRKLTHLFIFHNLVPDTAPYIKGCDLVVMPSLWEASGLVAMEVLVAGTPLVASKCIGLREVCDGTPAVLVEPANEAALEAGIIDAQEKGRDRFTSFVKIAKSRYSIENTRGQLQKIYAALVNR